MAPAKRKRASRNPLSSPQIGNQRSLGSPVLVCEMKSNRRKPPAASASGDLHPPHFLDTGAGVKYSHFPPLVPHSLFCVQPPCGSIEVCVPGLLTKGSPIKPETITSRLRLLMKSMYLLTLTSLSICPFSGWPSGPIKGLPLSSVSVTLGGIKQVSGVRFSSSLSSCEQSSSSEMMMMASKEPSRKKPLLSVSTKPPDALLLSAAWMASKWRSKLEPLVPTAAF